MKYFLHDTNSFQDEKISELFIEFGYEGLGLFYTILEKIAQQEKPIKTAVLKHQLNVGKKLEKCWKFMESLGIISSNNGETFNIRLLSYAETYQIKKEKTAKRISEYRKNQEVKENVTPYNRDSTPPKGIRREVKRSKEKRSKVTNTNTAPPLIEFEVNYPFDSAEFMKNWGLWLDYKKREKKFGFKTPQSLQAALNELVKLSAGNEKMAIAIIHQSLAKGWSGLFELKNDTQHGNSKQQQATGAAVSTASAFAKIDRGFGAQ